MVIAAGVRCPPPITTDSFPCHHRAPPDKFRPMAGSPSTQKTAPNRAAINSAFLPKTSPSFPDDNTKASKSQTETTSPALPSAAPIHPPSISLCSSPF
ncbi:hypothetical protein SLA2020_256900 [Shorea laevis]